MIRDWQSELDRVVERQFASLVQLRRHLHITRNHRGKSEKPPDTSRSGLRTQATTPGSVLTAEVYSRISRQNKAGFRSPASLSAPTSTDYAFKTANKLPTKVR